MATIYKSIKYISSDPAGINGGLNTFGYARSNPVSLIDPTGLKVHISRADGIITVSASITIYGPNGSAALAQQWQDYINNTWNNFGDNFHYGTCKVVFDVTVAYDPTAGSWVTANSADNYVYVDEPGARSWVWGPLRNLGGWAPAASYKEYAHEFGHMAGLNDHYPGRIASFLGLDFDKDREGDIMRSLSGEPTQTDINEIIDGYGM